MSATEPELVQTDVDRQPEHALEAVEREAARLVSIRSAARTPLNVTTNAYASSLVVASGAVTLLGFSGYNSNGSAQFVLVFDANTLPANGAVPKIILGVAGAANFYYQAGIDEQVGARGRVFHRGIVLANSSTGPTLTIGSADCWFDCQYL